MSSTTTFVPKLDESTKTEYLKVFLGVKNRDKQDRIMMKEPTIIKAALDGSGLLTIYFSMDMKYPDGWYQLI